MNVMKKLVLYFLLLMVVPATAQSGLFGSHSHRSSRAVSGEHHRGPLIRAGHYGHQGYPAPRREAVGMDAHDYEVAVKLIADETFDDNRLSTAKRIVADNPMSTRQIADICRLFTFDANRLEFAKFAHRHCVDPNKYFLLDEVFTFSSSKEELHKFIKR